MSTGLMLAILGAALAAALAGIGSAYGVHVTGKAVAGVTAENPDLFGKLLVLEAMPGTQGIYGLLVAVFVMINTGIFSGSPVDLSVAEGLGLLASCLPMALVGLFSAIYQGKAAVAAIHMVAKDPSASGKGITMVAIVETYAILALLISLLLIFMT